VITTSTARPARPIGQAATPDSPDRLPARADESLAQAGVGVAALWVDNEKTTAEFVAKHGLTFPLGHSADARAVAEKTGAFVNDDPLYLQSTGFVLDPQGKVIVSVYSSGAIGRLVPEDVIGLARYLREHAAPSS